jgi:hypothetical protein
MKNEEVRRWYKHEVGQIPGLNVEWLAEGVGAQDRALRAWQIRHSARLIARELMENPVEVEDLRNRDIKVYGNPEGPSFEFLVEKARKLGLSGDKIYEAIIDESSATNVDVDKRFEH